jgi:26S proteasome regulatory subunit N11
MERLQRIFGQTGMGQPGSDSPLLDSSEQVYISSLALLKMLKHGQSVTLTLTTPPPRPGEG